MHLVKSCDRLRKKRFSESPVIKAQPCWSVHLFSLGIPSAHKLCESLHNLCSVIVSVRHLVLYTNLSLISSKILCNPHLSLLFHHYSLSPIWVLILSSLPPTLQPSQPTHTPNILFYYVLMHNVTIRSAKLTGSLLWSLVDILSRRPLLHCRDERMFYRCSPDVRGLTKGHSCSVHRTNLFTQLDFCFCMFFFTAELS